MKSLTSKINIDALYYTKYISFQNKKCRFFTFNMTR